jgi:hypothetical protein
MLDSGQRGRERRSGLEGLLCIKSNHELVEMEGQTGQVDR